MSDWSAPYMQVKPALAEAERLLRHADSQAGIDALLDAIIALCQTITALREP